MPRDILYANKKKARVCTPSSATYNQLFERGQCQVHTHVYYKNNIAYICSLPWSNNEHSHAWATKVNVWFCSFAISSEKAHSVPIFLPFSNLVVKHHFIRKADWCSLQVTIVCRSPVLEHRKRMESPVSSNNNCSKYKHLPAHITLDIFFKSAQGTFFHFKSRTYTFPFSGYQTKKISGVINWTNAEEMHRIYSFTHQPIPTPILLRLQLSLWFCCSSASQFHMICVVLSLASPSPLLQAEEVWRRTERWLGVRTMAHRWQAWPAARRRKGVWLAGVATYAGHRVFPPHEASMLSHYRI